MRKYDVLREAATGNRGDHASHAVAAHVCHEEGFDLRVIPLEPRLQSEVLGGRTWAGFVWAQRWAY
jgi:hypothetical protein